MTGRFRKARMVAQEVRNATRPGSPSLLERLRAVPRLVRAVRSGEYTGLSSTQLALMMAGAFYVASPIDLVPEGVFMVAGLADDALVLAWLARALVRETEAFLEWERGFGVQDAMPGDARTAWSYDEPIRSHVVR